MRWLRKADRTLWILLLPSERVCGVLPIARSLGEERFNRLYKWMAEQQFSTLFEILKNEGGEGIVYVVGGDKGDLKALKQELKRGGVQVVSGEQRSVFAAASALVAKYGVDSKQFAMWTPESVLFTRELLLSQLGDAGSSLCLSPAKRFLSLAFHGELQSGFPADLAGATGYTELEAVYDLGSLADLIGRMKQIGGEVYESRAASLGRLLSGFY